MYRTHPSPPKRSIPGAPTQNQISYQIIVESRSGEAITQKLTLLLADRERLSAMANACENRTDVLIWDGSRNVLHP